VSGIQPILEAIHAAKGPLLLATLVRVEGSSYRQPGARLVMDANGPVHGSLSGGCLEADVFARGQECLTTGKPLLLRYDLRNDLDLIWGTGSGCEGMAEILVEPLTEAAWIRSVEAALLRRGSIRIATRLDAARLGERILLAGEERPDAADLFVEDFKPPIALWIFGAGDDARPLVGMAKSLGFFVGLVDHRPAFARPERFPEADAVKSLRPASGLAEIPLDARSAAILLTHHFDMDSGWMKLLMPSAAGYLGLMGHRRRGERILSELETAPTPEQAARFFSPVGLDLGSESPETIALSVLAEIQAVFGGKQAAHLRDAKGAIHALSAT
jgi:xanthine/CO dehydrogenase XdhC/CoxF family maturation factor